MSRQTQTNTPACPRRPLVYIAAAYISGIAFCYFFVSPLPLLAAVLAGLLVLMGFVALASLAAPAAPVFSDSTAPAAYVSPASFTTPVARMTPLARMFPGDSTAPTIPLALMSPWNATAALLYKNLFVLLLCIVFFAGNIYAHKAFSRVDPLESQMTDGVGRAEYVTGRVLFAEQRSVDYRQLTLWSEGRKLLVRVYGEKGQIMEPPPEDMIGRLVSVSGMLSYPDTKRNPGGFDYRQHLLSKDIRVILTCEFAYNLVIVDKAEERDGPNLHWRILGVLAQAKAAFSERVDGLLAPEVGALFNGMLFGDKEDLDDETYDLFKRHGVAHILSVSGLHVGMVYAFVSVALGRRKTRKFYLAVLVLLILYAALSNFSPSVMRAFSMIVVHIGAMLLNRRYDMLTGVLFSAFIMLIINPLALFGTGFILSYSAVCSLAFALPFADRHTGFRDKQTTRTVKPDKLRKLYGAGIITIMGGRVMKTMVPAAIIQFFMLPLTMYFFNCLPLLAVLVNIPIIALASLIVPFGIILLLLAAGCLVLPVLAFVIEPVIGVGATSSGIMIDAMLLLIRAADQIPYSSFTVPSPPLFLVLIFYFGVFYLLSDTFAMHCSCVSEYVRRRGARGLSPDPVRNHDRDPARGPAPGSGAARGFAGFPAIIALPAVIAVSCLLVFTTPMGKYNDALYTFVDVGQGDCLHIQTKDGRNYLMDGGGRYDYNVGKNILAPYLLKNGIGRLDGVFVSHLHMDHFKGLVELAQQVEIDAVYVYEGYSVNTDAVTRAFTGEGEAPGQPGYYDTSDNTSGNTSEDKTGALNNAFTPESLRFLTAGDVVLLGGHARAEILFPPKRPQGDYVREVMDIDDENRISLVIRFESESVSVLMTGDISKDGEAAAMGISDLSGDILKVSHHGSKSSTSDALLNNVNPAIAVIQVGRNNYGHPTTEVLESLASTSIPVYRNDKSGAIIIHPQNGGFTVQTVKRDFISPMLLKPFEKEAF